MCKNSWMQFTAKVVLDGINPFLQHPRALGCTVHMLSKQCARHFGIIFAINEHVGLTRFMQQLHDVATAVLPTWTHFANDVSAAIGGRNGSAHLRLEECGYAVGTFCSEQVFLTFRKYRLIGCGALMATMGCDSTRFVGQLR